MNLQVKKLILILIIAFQQILSQNNSITNKNFVIINSTDTEGEIITKAASVIPSKQQYEWQKLELIGFLHFGINTFTNREWGDGSEDPKIFNPIELNIEQWAKTFKEAGIKMGILTAKHHDGFCLWPSKFTEHSVKNSPWKNGKGDLVREFVDAFRKHGLKVGLYLSPWDRNNPYYGESPKYNEYYLNQLRELLSNYGEISEVWFDGACTEDPNGKKQIYDWQSYYRLIRELQPDAVIFGMAPDIRWVGTETGYGRDTEWNVIPIDLSELNYEILETYNFPIDEIFKPKDLMDYDLGSRDRILNANGLFWYPAETDVSIRNGWFYHESEDSTVKSAEKLIDIYFKSVGKNGVLLLNIPPDKRGLIHENDKRSLSGLKELLDKTFADNLIFDSHITINNSSTKYDFNSLFGKDKYWISQNGNGIDSLMFVFTNDIEFDVVMLQEEIRIGQRIEKFYIEYLSNDQWIKLTEGTTVGYKRLLRFEPIKTNKVKLVIEQSRTFPTLKYFGLYRLVQ